MPIFRETWSRSLVKALSYRVLITILDFLFVYFITKSPSIATGFVIISNIYTTIAYIIHERIWDNLRWGKQSAPTTSTSPQK